jgi:uncharacterized protein HemY
MAFFRTKGGLAIALVAAALAISALIGLALRGKPPAPQAPTSYSEMLLAQGDYRAAADALRAEYRARPTAIGKRKLVEALLAANDPASALALLRGSETDDLPPLEIRALRAEALLRLEQPDEAAAEVAPLEAHAPGVAALIRARAAFAKGDGTAADTLLADAVRAGGDAAQSAWLLRARYALARNDFAVAAAAAARAEEAGAPRHTVAALRIESAIRSGEFDHARDLLGPEKNTPRGEAENAFLRVLLDAAEGRNDAASIRLRMIEPALSREPRGRLVAAFVREGAGDFAQAEKHFRRAADAAPGDAIAQDAFVSFLVRRQKTEEASFAAQRLADVAPAAARLRQAEVLAGAGDYDAAFLILTEGPSTVFKSREAILGAKARPSDLESASEARADYYAAAATALLNDGAETPPLPAVAAQDPLALALAAEIALQRGDARDSQRTFAAASTAAPDFARAVAGEARAALQASGAKAARAVVFKALARASDDLNFRVYAARVRQGEGAVKDALSLLAPAERTAPQSQQAEEFHAELVIQSGDRAAVLALADALQRRGVLSDTALKVHLAAGRIAQAAAVADRLLAAGGASAETTALCLEAMAAAGDPDGIRRALIVAMARRRLDDAPLQAAAARLGRSEGLREAAEAARSAATENPVRLRSDYLSEPTSSAAAYRFALSLLAQGETRRGGAVLAEACFWGAQAACPMPEAGGGRIKGH